LGPNAPVGRTARQSSEMRNERRVIRAGLGSKLLAMPPRTRGMPPELSQAPLRVLHARHRRAGFAGEMPRAAAPDQGGPCAAANATRAGLPCSRVVRGDELREDDGRLRSAHDGYRHFDRVLAPAGPCSAPPAGNSSVNDGGGPASAVGQTRHPGARAISRQRLRPNPEPTASPARAHAAPKKPLEEVAPARFSIQRRPGVSIQIRLRFPAP